LDRIGQLNLCLARVDFTHQRILQGDMGPGGSI
jgi:hypothetical protein